MKQARSLVGNGLGTLGHSARRVLLTAALGALLVPTIAAQWGARRDVADMTAAAQRLLEALSSDQRAKASFTLDDDERSRFHFIPIEMFERRGVMLEEMDGGQREVAHALLRAGLSQHGYMTVGQVMELEDVLLAAEGGGRFARDNDQYLFAFFGTPGVDSSWGWRFEGHHLSLHFTIIGSDVAVATPAFVGVNPAEVREGPQRGRRVLGDREDAARTLVTALTPERRAAAIIAAEAPRDVLTGNEPEVGPLSPFGLAALDMSDRERGLLSALINVYLSIMSDEIADHRRRALTEAGMDDITFAWAGGLEVGQPHYYRVQGPTFLIEYDNTQNDANHIHSVWRDFDGDFGRDLLREHRAQHPHD